VLVGTPSTARDRKVVSSTYVPGARYSGTSHLLPESRIAVRRWPHTDTAALSVTGQGQTRFGMPSAHLERTAYRTARHDGSTPGSPPVGPWTTLPVVRIVPGERDGFPAVTGLSNEGSP